MQKSEVIEHLPKTNQKIKERKERNFKANTSDWAEYLLLS